MEGGKKQPKGQIWGGLSIFKCNLTVLQDGFKFQGTDLKTGVQGTQDMDSEVRNDALHMLMLLLSALKPTNSLKHIHNTKTDTQAPPVKYIGHIIVAFLQGGGEGI